VVSAIGEQWFFDEVHTPLACITAEQMLGPLKNE
jgi:hypothetical protein